MAVVVIPASPPQSGDSDPANLALLALTQQLGAGGKGAVLAGAIPGSGQGSAIDELISGNSGFALSSVDNANAKIGQIMVVQALNLELAGHKPASYGIAPGAVPSPAPSPTSTQSVTPTATNTSKHPEHR